MTKRAKNGLLLANNEIISLSKFGGSRSVKSELQQIEILVIPALNEQTMRHVFLINVWKSRAILSKHQS